jgi:putative acetyltransferase
VVDDLTLRTAVPEDGDAIVTLVREAFSSDGRDPQEEVDIVLATWKRGKVPAGFELVALDDGVVVGHLLAARGRLGQQEVVAVAPLAVLPPHQGGGVGRALMTELLHRAEAASLPLLVLLGDAAYYGRFGFELSGPLAITYRGEVNPHFLARRLSTYDPSYQGDFVYCWEAAGES